jgi:hypothetical protein
MYRLSIIFIFLIPFFQSEAAHAQDKNIIKGRIFALPINGVLWSFGVGYERVLPHNFSVQIIFNNNGTDARQYDGLLNTYNNIIPEIKYYFNPLEKISSSFFISTFLEIQKRKYRSSGESDDVRINGKYISPGFLLGKNMKLSQNMHFELYLGLKYLLGSEQKAVNKDGAILLTNIEIGEWGARSGFNLAYRF